MGQNTIQVKSYSKNIDQKNAVAAITPGHFIERTSADKVQKHSVATGTAYMVALEDDLQGNDIADAYSANNPVQCWIPAKGDQVYAFLANGESVVIGDKIASNGNGEVKKYSTGTVIAIALEAVDMSSSTGADSNGRIIIEMI